MTPERSLAASLLPASQLVGLTAYGEARNQPVLGVAAVIAVCQNRLATGRWGTTMAEVCLARHQFSCWNVFDANYPILTELAAHLLKSLPVGDDIVLHTCLWLAEQRFNDPTRGATHYYSPIGVRSRPSWSQSPALRTAIIGDHQFFTNVA